jgi:uncharacterized protein YcbK (DUF882 family)
MLQLNDEDQAKNKSDLIISRRRFLSNLACGALLSIATPTLSHAAKGRFHAPKSLAFQNINTGEKLKLTYFEKGRYIKPALREINFVLRDYRTGDIHPIDIDLLDQLNDIKLMLGLSNRPFHIISGYRSPSTNFKLHHESSGVANNSLHMLGKAIDVRIEGIDTKRIRNAALALRRGGVGYYDESNFVHLDTGKLRNWAT